MGGGSDLAADRWRADYRIAGTEALDLHQLYRPDGRIQRPSVPETAPVGDRGAWLGEELPEPEQDDRTPFAPRCTKDLVEERLFGAPAGWGRGPNPFPPASRRDLFSRLDLMFMDTTSPSFEGAGGQTLGRHGHSKDHRPDLPQMILAVLIDGDGRPVCSAMWPGHVADARRHERGWGPFPQLAGETLIPVIDRLRRRFAIGRICVVADRGMISAATVAALEARRLLYLLGTRERTDKVVRDVVRADTAPYVPLTIARRGQESDYEAKEVVVEGRRYVVCRNHQAAERDAVDRAAILAKLAQQLKKGDKALVGNTGFRRFLKTEGRHFAIDPTKAEADARFDGVFVLRTNTDLDPLAALLRYKQLWTVEAAFRTAKHLLATRPIFHKRDATIRGHVFCSLLALVLKAELEQRIAALGRDGSWPAILADLDSLSETEIAHDDRRFLVRAAPRPAASLALRAAGVALPPTVQAIAAD